MKERGKLISHTLNFVLIQEKKKIPVRLRRIYSQEKQNYTRSLDIADFWHPLNSLYTVSKILSQSLFCFSAISL